jgi:hypothetical protein
VAEIDERTENTGEDTARNPEKKVYDIKGGFKDKMRPILMTSVMLAVTVIAAAASLAGGMDAGVPSKSGFALFLSFVALLCWIGLTVHSVMKKDRTQSIIMMIIFGVSFVGFVALMLTSAGGGGEESSALILAALALPYFAAFPLFEAMRLSAGGVMAFVYIAIIAVNAWNFVRLLKLRKDAVESGMLGYMLGSFGDGGENKKDRW